MADQQPRKLWRIVLVISLALNLAVVGVVGGFMVRSSGDKGPPRSFDVGLGPIGRALDREDRRAAVRETAITALTNRIVGMSVADRHALADRLAENGRGSRKP